MKTSIIILFHLLSLLLTENKPSSINQLLDSPKTYHGKTVEVKGYYIDVFESRALWTSKSDARKHHPKHSLWIGTFNEKVTCFDKNGNPTPVFSLQNKKVIVTGTFNHAPDTLNGKIYGHGHMNAWTAELIDITSIRESK